jgi:nicotinamide riboside kinase
MAKKNEKSREMRIAFLGPESSGKTSIISVLQNDFKAQVIDEFAREYLKEIKTNYAYEDLEIIARKQFENIQKEYQNELILIDTELIVMKIWSEYKYQKCCRFIEDTIPKQKIDFYFLCKSDFPWEADELRENQHDREILFKLYEAKLIENNFNYVILEGNISERREFCHKIIKKLVPNNEN